MIYLSPQRFIEFPWAIWKRRSEECSGFVQCGLCIKANEQKCPVFNQVPNNVKNWIDGFNDWSNYSNESYWLKHSKTNSHKDSVNFLWNRMHQDIRQMGIEDQIRTK